jgi:hypothetical protein
MTIPSPRPHGLKLYNGAKSRTLPTRLYKQQDIGEMLAIIVGRDQLGVEFAKRMARSIAPPLDRIQVLNWFAKALGYHTWIQALQHRTDNGKIILSARQIPPGLRELDIRWFSATEVLLVRGLYDADSVYETQH